MKNRTYSILITSTNIILPNQIQVSLFSFLNTSPEIIALLKKHIRSHRIHLIFEKTVNASVKNIFHNLGIPIYKISILSRFFIYPEKFSANRFIKTCLLGILFFLIIDHALIHYYTNHLLEINTQWNHLQTQIQSKSKENHQNKIPQQQINFWNQFFNNISAIPFTLTEIAYQPNHFEISGIASISGGDELDSYANLFKGHLVTTPYEGSYFLCKISK